MPASERDDVEPWQCESCGCFNYNEADRCGLCDAVRKSEETDDYPTEREMEREYERQEKNWKDVR